MKPLNRILNAGLLVCLFPLALHFKATSQSSYNSKYPTDTVKFSASDSTVTDNDKHMVKLYGKACITNSTTRVNADYIEYNSTEKTGTAKGNVVFYDISENIIAKSSEATFNMK